MKMKNKYKAKGVSMLHRIVECGELSVVIAMAGERRYIKIIEVQVICAISD